MSLCCDAGWGRVAMRKAALCAVVSCFTICAYGQNAPPTQVPAPVATITLSNGHHVYFFVAPNGPVAIAETGPKGSRRVVDERTLRLKKPSEIYKMLKGRGAAPPPALIAGEKRVPSFAPGVTARPPQGESSAGKGEDDSADQMWFKATYCQQGWQCVQGWSWAISSSGHNQGRGYATDGMNGSEAIQPRNLETDWWDGSSWSTLLTVQMPPGWVGWITAGNVSYPACQQTTWYFKSEVNNNSADSATVSLADHVYAPGTAGPNSQRVSCYNCSCACSSACEACPTGRGGANFVMCPVAISSCPGDSCVNPP